MAGESQCPHGFFYPEKSCTICIQKGALELILAETLATLANPLSRLARIQRWAEEALR